MKLTLILGAASAFFAALVSAIDLKDLVTFQPADKLGGCSKEQIAILDTWHEEAIFSLANAVTALDENFNADTKLGRRVRQSMFSFFQVDQAIQPGGGPPKGTANAISKNINEVQKWLNGEKKKVKKEDIYLFCDTNFLVARAWEDPAQDYEGNEILVKGDLIAIQSVKGYEEAKAKNYVPWWSGDHSDLKGYWFESSESGGNYCKHHLGLTGVIKTLTPVKKGDNTPIVKLKQIVVICPSAFTAEKFRDSFAAGATDEPDPAKGETRNLDWALPKSATFTHEAFHIWHGKDFNEGVDSETYGLAECIQMAGSKKTEEMRSARKNPENYVYFSSAMHYLVEEELPKRWDYCADPHKGVEFDGSEDDEMGGT